VTVPQLVDDMIPVRRQFLPLCIWPYEVLGVAKQSVIRCAYWPLFQHLSRGWTNLWRARRLSFSALAVHVNSQPLVNLRTSSAAGNFSSRFSNRWKRRCAMEVAGNSDNSIFVKKRILSNTTLTVGQRKTEYWKYLLLEQTC